LPVKEKGITKKNFRGATMYHGIPLAKKIIFALIFAGILGTASPHRDRTKIYGWIGQIKNPRIY
jgi:hypothetical protein